MVIFLVALAARWTYALALQASMGRPASSATTFKYLALARDIAQKLTADGFQGWDWLGADPARMPMYVWLLASNLVAVGELAPFTTVLCQGVIDAATCLLVCAIAASLSPRFAFAAGIAASLNPTQIVLSGLVYSDTLFVFFVAVSLLGAMRWLRSASPQSAASSRWHLAPGR